MVIVKTPEFVTQFTQDLHWIEINKKCPLQLMGSFKVKDYGEIITDIDMQALVYMNETLINIISNILSKNRRQNSPFTFVHMVVGRYEGYKFPWTVDDRGGCDFDIEKTRIWFDWFKTQGLVPDSILNIMQNKLFSSTLTIRDLFDIDYLIYPYSNIIWEEADVRRGFVVRDNMRYNLLDVMKTKTPVLKYIYNYKGDYISIDVGLVDKKYSKSSRHVMYRYYTQDWYKVMKSFRWKIQEKYRPEYFEIMRNINIHIALKYQLRMLQNIEKHTLLPKATIDQLSRQIHQELDKLGISYTNMSYEQLIHVLYHYVDDQLRDKVTYFAELLNPTEKNKTDLRLQRGAEAQIPTTQSLLRHRRQLGIKCPFFSTDIDEFERLHELAIRTHIVPEKMVQCFSQIAEQLRVTVRQLLDEVVNNNSFSLLITDNEIILQEYDREKARFPHDAKIRLQTFILFGK